LRSDPLLSPRDTLLVGPLRADSAAIH
jgi:hypothetical protein